MPCRPSPNTTLRHTRFATAQHEYVPGHAINLLRIAAEPQVAEATRQAAAINFKNIVKRGWEAGTKREQSRIASLFIYSA